jgi:UDP-N-acetylmuramoyl-L-alanyl-D-glutamate--2,6-diaminopimelate ligase
VVCRPLGLGVPEVQVEDMRAAMAHAAARFYGDPTAELRVVGITGTSGKTTSAWLTRAMLEAAGMQTGLLGTVTSIVGGESRPVVRTTPEAIDLQRTFREMLDGGDVACAMEISSHALELRRAEGIRCAAAVFTNLSQDHLDFHPDMESYFLAKRKLFETDPGVRIACADDAYGRRLASEFPGTVTFGIDDGDLRALDLRADATGSSFTLRSPDGEWPVRLALPGRFNVLNALGAWASARALGASPEPLLATLASPPAVPGRFEPVDEGQPFTVVVDYAHKPGALENVLLSARAITDGRVIVVFGAGGDRDRAKRPLMGEIGARLADLAIITSDNPRSEDPDAIVVEVAQGVREGAVELEVDRRAAIGRAVSIAREGDIVVIAGKGHEQGQEFEGGREEPFDDVTVAREALQELKANA